MTEISTPVESEILSKPELVDITGWSLKAKQIEWLTVRGWKFTTNAVGEPIVGRWYARMKLAGLEFSPKLSMATPDFSKVI